MNETALVNACLIFLRSRGVFCWRTNTGAMTVREVGRRSRFIRFGFPGMSDICGILPNGRALFVECKRHPNKLTTLQQNFLEQARKAGALAGCVYDVDELQLVIENPKLAEVH